VVRDSKCLRFVSSYVTVCTLGSELISLFMSSTKGFRLYHIIQKLSDAPLRRISLTYRSVDFDFPNRSLVVRFITKFVIWVIISWVRRTKKNKQTMTSPPYTTKHSYSNSSSAVLKMAIPFATQTRMSIMSIPSIKARNTPWLRSPMQLFTYGQWWSNRLTHRLQH
jgi:hypothetical protein